MIRKIFILTIAFSLQAFSMETIEIEISIKDHKFIPEIIKAPKNTKIKLIVHNLDDTAEEFESFDLKREKIVPPKSKVNIILPPLKEGRYFFFGDFNKESAQGYLLVQ